MKALFKKSMMAVPLMLVLFSTSALAVGVVQKSFVGELEILNTGKVVATGNCRISLTDWGTEVFLSDSIYGTRVAYDHEGNNTWRGLKLHQLISERVIHQDLSSGTDEKWKVFFKDGNFFSGSYKSNAFGHPTEIAYWMPKAQLFAPNDFTMNGSDFAWRCKNLQLAH